MTWVEDTIAYPSLRSSVFMNELSSMNQVSSREERGNSEICGNSEKMVDRSSV